MRTLVLLLTALTVACRAGLPSPATLDTGHDACRSCRMVVSDQRLAAQIVEAGEEPAFFDDLGCLSAFLRTKPPLGSAAGIYVADHRTGDWILASNAVYTRIASGVTPMNGGIIAHATPESRDGDPAARGGTNVPSRDVSRQFEQAH